MSDCPHTPKYPDLASIPTLQEALSHCSIVENDEHVAKSRALTSADGQTTRLDSAFWSGLTEAQKTAVVAHERAHPAIGMQIDCEGCADKVGGFYMRAWGYAPEIVKHSFSTLRAVRPSHQGNIAENAAKGAQAAERGLASRGLLGKSSTSMSSALLQLRTPAPSRAPRATQGGTVLGSTSAEADRSPATQAGATADVKPTSPAASSSGSPLNATPSPQDFVTVAQTTPPSSPPPSGDTGVSVTTPAGPAKDTDKNGRKIGDPLFDFGFGPGVIPEASLPVGGFKNDDLAGDVVSSVLGESARPHATKVLIAAGVAATLAIVLVIIVRHASK